MAENLRTSVNCGVQGGGGWVNCQQGCFRMAGNSQTGAAHSAGYDFVIHGLPAILGRKRFSAACLTNLHVSKGN